MKLTKEQMAAILNGREYGHEVTKDEERQAKESGLFVIHGYSDDNVEVYGVERDEIGAYCGTEFRLHVGGIVRAFDEIDHDDEEAMCQYFASRPASKAVKAVWGVKEGPSWTFQTDIPHATFDVFEDGELFCRGIVIDAADLA